jgi:long-chain acyl-CoA synthetase
MFYDRAQTLAEYIETALDEHRKHLFLRDLEGRAVTYGQARQEIARLHDLFRADGIRPGDKIALLGNNGVHWGLIYLAAVTYGAVAVPILPNFTSTNVHNIINMSDTRIVFVSASMLEKLADVAHPHPEKIFLLEDFREINLDRLPEFVKKLRKKFQQFKERAQSYFGRHRAEVAGAPAASGPDDLATIVYTSGTTGNSKGVMLTQRNLVENVKSCHLFVRLLPEDRFLSLLPMAHTYECTVGFLFPMGAGCSITYLEGKPSPKVLMEAFAQVRPTLVLVVPLIIEKIYFKIVRPRIEKNILYRQFLRFQFLRRLIHRMAVRRLLKSFGGALKVMAIGGAPLNPEVETFLREGNFPYLMGYGMTECAPLITGSTPPEARFQSCGHAIRGMQIRIDRPFRVTGIGEVLVQGPCVTQGYYKNPEATAEIFTPDGWLRTGDLGRLDDDGFLHLIGRSKNVILGASGENIYPEEIEHHLNKSGLILESLVVKKDGRLMAHIVPDYDAVMRQLKLVEMNDIEVRKQIRGYFSAIVKEVNLHLPDFSQISDYELREQEFEKTPTEKIKRFLYTGDM